LRNGSTGNVSETHETGSATYLHLVFSVFSSAGLVANGKRSDLSAENCSE